MWWTDTAVVLRSIVGFMEGDDSHLNRLEDRLRFAKASVYDTRNLILRQPGPPLISELGRFNFL